MSETSTLHELYRQIGYRQRQLNARHDSAGVRSGTALANEYNTALEVAAGVFDNVPDHIGSDWRTRVERYIADE